MLSYHTSPLAPLGGKHSGGMNVYVRELSAQLAKLGHQVDIFTRGGEPEEQNLAEGARLITIAAGPKGEVQKELLPEYIQEFSQAILQRGEAYDLIHAHYWMSGLAGIALKDAWSAPMVLMFHTLGLVKNRISLIGERESDERIRGERRALAAADMVVAATPAEQADLQWLYEVPSKRICVIPPGVDLQHFKAIDKPVARTQLGISNQEAVVLFVGRIEALKGIETLIKATRLMLDEYSLGKTLRVLIVGGSIDEGLDLMGSELARLRNLVSELGVQDHVQFLGSRTQAELPAYYSAADVVAMPSYSESFGMVALEAMACARPVVASRVGGLAYLVQDGVTGFHVQEGDPAGLANKLSALLKEPDLLATMGGVARVEAANYSWEQTANEILALYGQIMTQNELQKISKLQ